MISMLVLLNLCLSMYFDPKCRDKILFLMPVNSNLLANTPGIEDNLLAGMHKFYAFVWYPKAFVIQGLVIVTGF